MPGFGSVKNNDIVVFNYPDGDTVAIGDQNSSYYELTRQLSYLIKREDLNNSQVSKSDDFYYSKAWEYMNNSKMYFLGVINQLLKLLLGLQINENIM